MAKIRVTRFARKTRYSILVPNESPFEPQMIKHIVRTPRNSKIHQCSYPCRFDFTLYDYSSGWVRTY